MFRAVPDRKRPCARMHGQPPCRYKATEREHRCEQMPRSRSAVLTRSASSSTKKQSTITGLFRALQDQHSILAQITKQNQDRLARRRRRDQRRARRERRGLDEPATLTQHWRADLNSCVDTLNSSFDSVTVSVLLDLHDQFSDPEDAIPVEGSTWPP